MKTLEQLKEELREYEENYVERNKPEYIRQREEQEENA